MKKTETIVFNSKHCGTCDYHLLMMDACYDGKNAVVSIYDANSTEKEEFSLTSAGEINKAIAVYLAGWGISLDSCEVDVDYPDGVWRVDVSPFKSPADIEEEKYL